MLSLGEIPVFPLAISGALIKTGLTFLSVSS